MVKHAKPPNVRRGIWLYLLVFVCVLGFCSVACFVCVLYFGVGDVLYVFVFGMCALCLVACLCWVLAFLYVVCVTVMFDVCVFMCICCMLETNIDRNNVIIHKIFVKIYFQKLSMEYHGLLLKFLVSTKYPRRYYIC